MAQKIIARIRLPLQLVAKNKIKIKYCWRNNKLIIPDLCNYSIILVAVQVINQNYLLLIFYTGAKYLIISSTKYRLLFILNFIVDTQILINFTFLAQIREINNL